MEKNKTNITNVTKDGIVKGKIANAITSAAKNHIVATTDDIYDVNFKEYQDSINKRLNGSISGLKSDITKIKGDVTTINSKITNMQGDITNIKGNITTLNNEVAGVKSDVAKTKNDIVTINGKITNIQGNITTINREISSIQNDITNVKNNIVTINRDISNIHGDITTIKNNITTINNEIIALQNSIASIQTNINTINNEISGLHGDISEINNKITSIQDDISGIKELIPIDATPLNQLADKQFVIDLIHSTSSAFRGNWNTWVDVPTDSEEYPEDGEGNRIPRQGDYIVIVDASEYIGENTGKTYEGSWRFVYEGDWETNNKDGWKPEYQINEKPELIIHFHKKKEGEEISTPITDVKVTDKNTLLTYPELRYSEFVNGGYWDTNITTLRNVTGETTVYYITPFLTITDNETLLKICYNNGWSSSQGYLTINEAESITDEMVAEASKKLSLIEDEQGNLIEVFDSIIFVEEGEEPIVMARYNLYDGLCYDKNGNEYNIKDCVCYSKDGKKYSLDEVKYGNCFYELESWTELPYFTGITKLGDGETYRVFLNYSRIRDIILDVNTLPAYTLFRCVNLQHLYIPSGLTEIDTYAIASCDGLQSLVVDENNPKYTSRNSQGVECNCIVEKPVATRGTRSAINNQLTLIQGCNVTTLPDNIKHIASGAFDECTRLASITLPDGLLTIGDNVFRGCTALAGSVIIPNTVESIGESTFRSCTALEGVDINVPVISEQLFKDCSSLSSVTLGNNVTEIGIQAFMNDSSLTAITIPDSITVAGYSAFMNCDLRSVNTNKIETISVNLFANNYNLSNITMTDSTVNIRDNAFDSASISAITIPQNVRSLSNTAFRNCNNLQRVVWDVNDTEPTGYASKFLNNSETIRTFEFGEHCTVIPNGLCSRMYNIESIIIPNTIIRIGTGVFAGSPISIGSGIKELVIPDSVTNIGSQMCFNCVSLETVTIGGGVTVIPSRCFAGCSSLETVDLSNNPNKINLQNINAFQGCDNLSLIIVPDELITDYRESQDWYEYREIIFGTSIYTITFDSVGGETTPSVQHVRCGGYIENPGTVHKDLYEFEYWEDEDGNEWDFEEDYVVGDMTLYAHYGELRAIMIKSISTGVTNISMQYVGNNPANVEYSYDGLSWTNIWNNNYLTISLSEGYSDYVYFRGYNPNGFSRATNRYTNFNINNGQCNLLGNIMYLKDYNQELNTVSDCEFICLFLGCHAIADVSKLLLPATTLASNCYQYMFSDCSSLTTTPSVLPATTLAGYCYNYMFQYCSSLTAVPSRLLQASTLTEGCYSGMFAHCGNLTTAPELPATTLSDSCYSSMFRGCSNLNYIKCLATDISASNCTTNWVYGVASSGTFVKHPFAASWDTCTTNGIPCNWTVEDEPIQVDNYIIFTALEDNSTIGLNRISSNQKLLYSTDDGETWNNFTTGMTITLENSGDTCYVAGMLSGNNTSSNYTNFVTTGKIEVSGNLNSIWNYENLNQNLYQYCGYYLFNGCTGLVDASGLSLGTSATTLERSCYQDMFHGCRSLIEAPELPATTLANNCYQSMFQNCSGLTTAPELPATTLVDRCYSSMFGGCSSLMTAPELPATTLASYCYVHMFRDCSSLTTAPVLPSTTLAEGCYYYMFYGCSNLNYIKCLAVNGINQNNSTYYWVYGVANEGTFVYNIDAEGLWTDGNNGIPTGWNRMTMPDNYITFTVQEDNSVIGINKLSSYQQLWYSDNEFNTRNVFDTSITLNMNSGDTVYVWGILSGNNTSSDYTQFNITGKVSVSGNINSLWNYNDLSQPLYKHCGSKLFASCTATLDASKLILGIQSTTLSDNCYSDMFFRCTLLTKSPELPATTLANGCYNSMFYGCTNLTTVPELPATTLEEGCYAYMFYECNSLTTVPELPATTLKEACYCGMFYGCTSLTTAPELPATTLANYCYEDMFSVCTSLTTAPELPATALAYGCYKNMFQNCTSLTTAPELPATTLVDRCYENMFKSCANLTTAPELRAMNLSYECYRCMFQYCSNLNYIKCIAKTGIGTNSSTVSWVYGIQTNSGTFVKHPDATNWTTGNSGIPTNWTVEDAVIE